MAMLAEPERGLVSDQMNASVRLSMIVLFLVLL